MGGGENPRILADHEPARTVADCFNYRNKVGLDVAMEALRECMRDRKATVDELARFARLDRVGRVMRPYLEATVQAWKGRATELPRSWPG